MYSKIWHLITSQFGARGRMALLALTSAVSAVAEAALMALVAITAAGIASESNVIGPVSLTGFEVAPTLNQALLAMVAALAVRGVAQVGVVYLPVRLSGDVQLQLRRRLVRAFLHANWRYQIQEAPGTMQELATGHVSQVASLVRKVAEGIAALITILVMVSASFLTHPAAAALAVTIPLAVSLLLRPLTRAVRRQSTAVSSATLNLADRLRELSRFGRLAHTFGTYDGHLRRLDKTDVELRQRYIKARVLSKSIPALYQFIILSGVVAGLWITATAATTSLATVGAVLLLLLRAAAYGQQVQNSYQAVNELSAYGVRLSGVMEALEANQRPSGEHDFPRLEEFTVSGVSFSYGDEAGQEILQDTSLTLRQGEAVAIVGRSGSGKSTLIDLVAGLLPPRRGEVLINGRPLSEFKIEAITQSIAYVPQEPPLLDDTVAQNIRYLRPDISDQEILRAARMAGIYEEVIAWPEGFGTFIGDEHGRRVSGGQRKRLGLARALAGRPAVLVLDEPTSSLDARTEQTVARALSDLHGKVTMLIVTHSLDLLDYCDRVFELSRGYLSQRIEDPLRGEQ